MAALFADGGGHCYALDLGSSAGSPVRRFRIEESDHPIEFGSLQAMLATLATAFDRRIFFVDATGAVAAWDTKTSWPWIGS